MVRIFPDTRKMRCGPTVEKTSLFSFAQATYLEEFFRVIFDYMVIHVGVALRNPYI